MSGKHQIIIYTERVTNRLQYACQSIFEDHLGLSFTIVTSIDDVPNDGSFVIEYNTAPTYKYPFVPCEGLLHEAFKLRNNSPTVEGQQTELVLFPLPANHSQAILPFDILSAVFYCLSLYQAYQPIPQDQHQRIDFNHWWIRKNGLDQFPYVEIWIKRLSGVIKSFGIEFIKRPVFKLQVSIDIDHFFKFSNRTLVRHLKGLAGDVFHLKGDQIAQRIKVLSGLQKDHYQAGFEHVYKLQLKSAPLFFILMKEGNMNSLNINNPAKYAAILRLKEHGQVGIHPSYFSSDNQAFFLKEKSLLETCTGKSIIASRQHFLRYKIPSTFLKLHETGIQEDHSLGYPDQPGFMAATASPFWFYNLEEESIVDLHMHPFCWMDSMNKYYRTIGPKEEKTELLQWIEKVKSVNGIAEVVFHNDSFTDVRYRNLLLALSDC